MTMVLTNIDESEWEDLETELRRRGRSRAEFEFSEEVHRLVGPGVQATRSTLTVAHRTSGNCRQYAAGHGSRWIAEFARDLDAGVF
jgi:hypothetical protein